MNRIQLPGWKRSANLDDVPSADDSTIAQLPSVDSDTPYSLFAPLHYEPNYAYPLLIWLHGPESDEREVQRLMPLVSLRNYVAIAPRGVCCSHDDAPSFHWGQSSAALVRAERAVADAIGTAQRQFHINSELIFLAGYAAGGTMALRIGLRNPELFAGVASLGGKFPRRHAPLVALPRLRSLRLLLALGRDSASYPVESLCDDLRLFHAARLSVAIRQYPCGDELRTPMLEDLNRWIMERVTGQPAEPTPVVESAPAFESN